MLDELLVGGEIQETSKKNIIRAITAQDMLQEVRTVTHDNLYMHVVFCRPAVLIHSANSMHFVTH